MALTAVAAYFNEIRSLTDQDTNLTRYFRVYPSPDSISQRVRYLLGPGLPLVWQNRFDTPQPGVDQVSSVLLNTLTTSNLLL